MLNAKITGLASYIPDSILDNEMLSKMVDTNDEWITTRVGVKERRILRDPDKGSSYMGIKAVNKMLAETGTNPQDIDLLICATSNPDYRFPSTASVIAHGCGLDRAYAYDIQAACAGFLVALQDARAYISSGIYKKIVVVAAEKMSSMTDYQDRATCPLFGDAAACMLVEPTEEPVGIIDAEFHVDGRPAASVDESRRQRSPHKSGNPRRPRTLRLPGRPRRLPRRRALNAHLHAERDEAQQPHRQRHRLPRATSG